jgi:uncharacterized GH25 family protein
MTRMMNVALMTMMMALVVACSTPADQKAGMTNTPAGTSTGTTAPASGSAAELTFKSDPETPKTGENAFEVTVMQDGKPVSDAQVSVELQMPAMPQMNMAEMKTKTDLSSAGDGVYRGKGQVMMAGTWNVTVMAMRNGQDLATRKFTVTAKAK